MRCRGCAIVALAALACFDARASDARLEGVAVLINERADGKTGWGAALLLDDDGLALTSLHVVADSTRLLALLYDPAQPSYTAAEGGLSRVAFERARDLKDVELVRGDPTVDLAVVRIRASTRSLRRLAFSSGPARAGDTVIAVGHPGENLWSFSRGLLGQVRDGFLQHDAQLAGGSSGGPLLNEHGEVVGVNTLAMAGDARGFSLARPAALAHALIGEVVKPLALDLSTPEAAARSCARARELGSDRVADCIDWQAYYDDLVRAFEEALARAQVKQRGAIVAWMRTTEARAQYADAIRAIVIGMESGDDAVANRGHTMRVAYVERLSRGGAPERPGARRRCTWIEMRMSEAALKKLAAHPVFSDVNPGPSEAELDRRAFERNGLKQRVDDPEQLRQILRLGLRIDGGARVDARTAWVFATGRNFDKTTYRFSSLWVERAGAWRERVPTDADLARPPKGAAPTLVGMHAFLIGQIAQLEAAAAALSEAGTEGCQVQFHFIGDDDAVDITPNAETGVDISVTPAAGK